mmetsp:Transcript_71382/g.119449  ORF Transcript_71382/g.119449 Transcript_71382/m.119449 type:complete len:83 (-) Transcript_71382:303-551(-)
MRFLPILATLIQQGLCSRFSSPGFGNPGTAGSPGTSVHLILNDVLLEYTTDQPSALLDSVMLRTHQTRFHEAAQAKPKARPK